jgi:hypothetical protein
MLRRTLLRRPSPALVVATIALILAVGGTGYALTLPTASVGPAQLRPLSVLNSKMATRQTTNSKLAIGANSSITTRDGSLGGVDIKDHDLTANDINQETLTPNYVAYIRATGSTGFASPGVFGASQSNAATIVHFPVSVAGKPILVSLATGSNGQLSAAPCGGNSPGAINCPGALNNPTNVAVFHYDGAGLAAARGFYITVPRGQN